LSSIAAYACDDAGAPSAMAENKSTATMPAGHASFNFVPDCIDARFERIIKGIFPDDVQIYSILADGKYFLKISLIV
jgi:hypothetical protein